MQPTGLECNMCWSQWSSSTTHVLQSSVFWDKCFGLEYSRVPTGGSYLYYTAPKAAILRARSTGPCLL
jgi:hypothetical protein